MATYTFNLHSFVINQRRTNHPWGGGTDTVKISIGLKVGDYQYPALYRNMGDLGSTGYEYLVDLAFQNIEIDDLNAPVTFSFVMMNSGHKDESKVENLMKQGANYLVEKAIGLIPSAGFWGLVASGASELAKWLVDELAAIAFADCDGLVASDVYTFRAGDLLTLTQSQAWHRSRSYPGLNSPSGCGGNSDYSVNCAISMTAQNVVFGGLFSLVGNDQVEIYYGDSYDHFNGTRLPDAIQRGLRPVQLWSSPADGGRWGGLFRSGTDASEWVYGDSYDEFNGPRLADTAARGLAPIQIWLNQWGGAGARWGGLFRTGNTNYAIHYGDDFDTFANQTLQSEVSQGRGPAQVWKIFGDDGTTRWGGLFVPNPAPGPVVWGDSLDYFQGTRLGEMTGAGFHPTQLWTSRQGNDVRWGGLFQAGTPTWEIVYGDPFDAFNNSTRPQLAAKGLQLSQFWTVG
jgi:hypothetical protein